MDRISALRNVEEALAAFEDGESSLDELERRVRATVRTYATEFDGDLRAYRAVGDGAVDGLVVLAGSPDEARERVVDLVAADPQFRIERAPVDDLEADAGPDADRDTDG